MAGDWIPMQKELWECPQVVRILSAMCPQDVRDVSARMRRKCEIIGAMFRVWGIFDTFTEDGILHGYTAETLNETVGIERFAENLAHVGWLVIREDSLEMPGFSRHLGKSAKRRMRDAERKRDTRRDVRNPSAKCPQNVRNEADKKRTTEQKRTEEKSIDAKASITSAFETWWTSYPKKVSKDAAAKAYVKAIRSIGGNPGDAATSLLNASLPRFERLARRDTQYIPNAATWLNSRGWEDDLEAISPQAKAIFGPGQNYDPNHDYEAEAF